MRTYYIQYNVGNAKYVVNFDNGVDKHADGSPFFHVVIFKKEKSMQKFIKKLKENSYTEKLNNN